eukprot:TRINITY_DN477_c2_g1_i1.p1 TRINITY_DN477_c2_g1~~TRINITY_DN477_c2_g1_i1.p1  ORF type:complete len:288 (+),score=62.59 TRINITY_DN477_c2_g1_i1:35-865(+)
MNMNNNNARVKLDVGGKLFSTSMSTLLSQSDTFFSKLFSGDFDIMYQEDGSIFIDRDPIVFRYILNFLRGYCFDIESVSTQDLNWLYEDAKFYQIKKLEEKIEDSQIEGILDFNVDCFSNTNLIFSNQNKTIKCGPKSIWGNARTNYLNNGKHFTEIKITNSGGNGHIRIGICNKGINLNKDYAGSTVNSLALYPGGYLEGFHAGHYPEVKMVVDDIIGMELDFSKNQLTYYFNGIKIVSIDLPLYENKCEWAFFFSLHCSFDEITLIPNKSLLSY